MELKKLQKIGGVSAILEGFIYVFAFIVYGGILVYPNANAGTTEKLNFLIHNYLTLSILNLISYVLFGILLGWVIINDGNILYGFLDTIQALVDVFKDSGNTRTIMFCALVGALIVFIQRSGGVEGFILKVNNLLEK